MRLEVKLRLNKLDGFMEKNFKGKSPGNEVVIILSSSNKLNNKLKKSK